MPGIADRIAQVSALSASGHFGFALEVIAQIEREVRETCSGDSAVLSDLAYLEGNIDLLRSDPVGARSHYRAARHLATDAVRLSRIDQNTGAAWFLESDYDKASRYFIHALTEHGNTSSLFPGQTLSLYDNLGAAAFEGGRLSEAQKWWGLSESIAAQYFSSDSLTRSRTAHNSALALFGRNELLPAVEKFREATGRNPGKNQWGDPWNQMIRKNLAMALIRTGSLGEAVIILDELTSRNHELPRPNPVFMAEILRLRAWISLAQGRFVETDSLLAAGFALVEDKARADPKGIEGLVRFRLLRDRSSVCYFQNMQAHAESKFSSDTLFQLQQSAFKALTCFRSPDGSLPGFILLHDSVEELLYRTMETGYSLIPDRVGMEEQLLSFVSDCRGRMKRADAAAGRATGDPVTDSLMSEWRSLNRKIYRAEKRALQKTDNGSPTDPWLEAILFSLKNESDSLSSRILAFGNVDSADLLSSAKTVEAKWKHLSSGEAILNFVVFPDLIYIFVIKEDTLVLARTEAGPSFRDHLNALKRSLQTGDDLMFGKECGRVSEVLIQPILSCLPGIKRLYIVPDRSVIHVPFECLMALPWEGTTGMFLARQFAISYHLSLGEVTPDRWPHTETSEALCRGDAPVYLGFSPEFLGERNLYNLNNTLFETEEIAGMFLAAGLPARVFLGKNADEPTLIKELPGGRIIHIATHANADRMHPQQSGFHLWKESPGVLGDALLDGIFEMGEVNGLKLHCELLTLSSCTLNSSDLVDKGTTINVNTGFLDAGAKRVLSSLWNVSDRHTRTLMTEFYKFYLEGNTFPMALQKAKVKLMRDPATASPYFWAPFVLFSR